MAEAEARLTTALDNLRHAQGLGSDDVEAARLLEKSARFLRSSIESELDGS